MPPFSPEIYLSNLSRCVSAAQVRSYIRKSADFSKHGWDYDIAIADPLTSHLFPDKCLGELRFALENLLVATPGSAKHSVGVRFYLASVYLFVSRREPGGIPIESLAIRIGLELLFAQVTRPLIQAEVYGEFLAWLTSTSVASPTAENFFLNIGILIIKSQSNQIEQSDLQRCKFSMPSWIRGYAETRLMTCEVGFPASWKPLATQLRSRDQVAPLLGMKLDSKSYP
jgi:hypothetical protein